MSSTAPTQPVVVRPRISRKPLPPRVDLTQAFQTMMPYVAVVLISLIAYSAYHKSDTKAGQLSIFSFPPWSLQQSKSDAKEVEISDSIQHLEELKQAYQGAAETKLEGLKQAVEEKFDAAKEKFADIQHTGSQKWEDLKESAGEKLDEIEEKLEEMKDSAEEKFDAATEKLPEMWQQWKSWGEGKIDELKEAMAKDQRAPTEVAPFTKKVSDFLLHVHSGDIEDSTILKYFGVGEEWRSMTTDERNDQLLRQMHRFGPRAVEFLIDGIMLDYSTMSS